MGTSLHNQNPTIPNRRRWWYHTILIGGYVFCPGIVGLLEGKHQFVAGHSHPVGGVLFGSALELILFGLVFGLAFYLSRATADDLLLRWRGYFRPIWTGACYSIGLRLVVSFLLKLLFVVLIASGAIYSYQILDIAAAQSSGLSHIVSSSSLRSSPIYFWISLLFTSFVMAGLREELWRSAFICGLKALWPEKFSSRTGQIAAITIAAAIFGFGHTTQSPLAVLHAGLMGFGFGSIMIYHRSIWPAVIAHGLFDATTMLVIRFS
jgi:membrane protease YdiL (CAAX protease family)